MSETIRTKEVIDKEYTEHAIMYGHTSRMLQIHMDQMQKLAKEAQSLPKEEPKLEAVQEPEHA